MMYLFLFNKKILEFMLFIFNQVIIKLPKARKIFVSQKSMS